MSEPTKIDLAEIAIIAESIRHREDLILPEGWKKMQIALALERIPKLVTALKTLLFICLDVNEDGEKNASIEKIVEAYNSAGDILSLFKDNQNG